MLKYLKHFKTITTHKYYVMCACFKCGIYKLGILHDLSKYSLFEFFKSARFFQGNRSLINAEKEKYGFSMAWQSHKGRNKHHWEYWIDWDRDGSIVCIEMPKKYIAEMICDWVGAGKAYNKGNWDIYVLKYWYENHKCKIKLNKNTKYYVEKIINLSKDEADLYRCIRAMLIKGYIT